MEKIMKLINQGKVVLVGESRGAKAEVVSYVSKKTGQKQAFTKVTHVVEPLGGGVPLLVEQVVSDQAVDLTSVKLTVEKGKSYAFSLGSLAFERGMGKARMQPSTEPVAV